MIFEILCLDHNETVYSKTVESLLHAFQANVLLFPTNKFFINKHSIVSKDDSLKIEIRQFDTSKFATGARYSLAYIIRINSENIDSLEYFRIQIVEYLKEMKFSNIRIMLDEVSREYAVRLYPTFYKLENKVREFIVNFFLKNIGPNWIDFAIPKEIKKKITDRIANEELFVKPKLIDADVLLLDFDDLGEILYGEKSILTHKNDMATILDKVSKATDLNTLKSELLEGNFSKYFKDCFISNDLKNKWFILYYFRNKIAHNSYFSKKEYEDAVKLCDEVALIIDNAYKKLDTFKLSMADLEAVQNALKYIDISEFVINDKDNTFSIDNSLVYSNTDYYKAIDEETLLNKLKEESKKLKFVGLKYFVRTILGSQGYSYNSSYSVINLLVDKGKIKINKQDNPFGLNDTTTIEIIGELHDKK